MKNELTGMVAWNFRACARQYRVTIRQVAAVMGITLKRVRQVRDSKAVSHLTAWEFVQGIKAARLIIK